MRTKTAWIAVFAALAGMLGGRALTAGQMRGETADCIAALVNDEVITLADIRIAETFGLVETLQEGMAPDARRAILEILIDRKVVLDLTRERTAFDPARVQTELSRIAARLGPEGMRERLAAFGLTLEDILPYIEEMVRVETIIADRFSRSVSVSLKEIESVYGNVYTPAETKDGRTPRPLVEMIETIEAGIRAGKIKGQAVLWIQNLRDQAEIEIRPDCLKK